VALFDAWLPRGVSRDPKARLRALFSSARRDPREALEQARGVAQRLTHEVRQKLGARWVEQEATPHERQLGTEGDDLLVTGRLAAAMVRAYDRHVRPIARPVQLFRAMDRTEPDWWTLDWDLGWGQVLEDISVHPVEGSHLGILRAGHVDSVARELDRAMAASDAVLQVEAALSA
jgi:thioesterase domain-containing protein